MSFERFMNAAGDEMPWSYEGWRCVYCGEVIDAIILHNRMKAKGAVHEKEMAVQEDRSRK
jgi:hypothetical protein